MGSWSVYCGISKVAITAGDECVLLPLKKARGEAYMPYVPATLPIFGEYDDYGGIENIKKDDNTKLIEEHFGVKIKDFATFLIDGKFTYERDKAKKVQKKIKNLEEVQDWRFMFIDKKVYDFMSSHLDKWSKGYLHFGNPKFMEALGFEYVGEDKENKSYDPKRFFHVWKHGEKLFLSDNWVILNGVKKKSSYIYYITPRGKYSDKSSLSNFIEIPENMKWVAEKADWQMWRYKDKNKQFENLSILGKRYDELGLEEMLEQLSAARGLEFKEKEYKTLVSKYKRDFEQFGDRIADLVTIRHNLHPMSGYFEPHMLYLTPQTGDFENHQILLEKFAEINKSKIYLENEE